MIYLLGFCCQKCAAHIIYCKLACASIYGMDGAQKVFLTPESLLVSGALISVANLIVDCIRDIDACKNGEEKMRSIGLTAVGVISIFAVMFVFIHIIHMLDN